MNRIEFGQLVAALRKENIDLLEGKVWTQKTLAERANLSERTIGQIEQGAKMNLDPQTLAQLAEALNLTSLERSVFFGVAAEVDIHAATPPVQQAKMVLDELLRAIREVRLPAAVYDAYGNVIAANPPILAVSSAPPEFLEAGAASPAGYNLLRYYFAPESSYRSLLGANWSQYALRNVQHFRAASLPFRHTPRFAAIFKDLCRYPLFQDFWARTKYANTDVYYRWDGVEYHHPQLGDLNYLITEATSLTGREQLFLETYVPRSRQTVQTFEELAQRVGLQWKRFMPWPYEE